MEMLPTLAHHTLYAPAKSVPSRGSEPTPSHLQTPRSTLSYPTACCLERSFVGHGESREAARLLRACLSTAIILRSRPCSPLVNVRTLSVFDAAEAELEHYPGQSLSSHQAQVWRGLAPRLTCSRLVWKECRWSCSFVQRELDISPVPAQSIVSSRVHRFEQQSAFRPQVACATQNKGMPTFARL